MQDGWKAVWSIPYVSVAFFPSLKQNFIAYRSSKVSDCHSWWISKMQSAISRVYSNCCCSCWFEPEIIEIGQSSHKMYSNNIVNFQASKTILNACTKKVWKAPLLDISRVYSNCCCSLHLKPEIIKIDQSSHKMYSNKILNFQASTTLLNSLLRLQCTCCNVPTTSGRPHGSPFVWAC